MTDAISDPSTAFVPAYAEGTRAADFAWWSETFLVQTVDQFAGLPLLLEPWQHSFFSEALALDTDDRPYWKLVVLVVARKNGKTAMLAAYSLYHLLESDGSPEVLLAASSDKQAGRLFDAGCSFLRANTSLDERVHLREYIGEIARRDGAGKIIRMASDPGRAHGYNPSLVVCDELHAWTTPSLRRAWGAFTTAGGARHSAQIFAITTAGEARERNSSILGRILDQNEQRGHLHEQPGLTVSRNHQARTLVYKYQAPTLDRNDVAALKLANPASWITNGYLREQAENPALTDAEVLQLHGCVWAAGESTWIAPAAWAQRQLDRSVDPQEKVVLGFDGSYRRDATALVGCTLDGHLFELAVWERPERASGGWKIPRQDVDDAVRDALERYHVVELACDPPGWHAEIDSWAAEYGENTVIQFPTNQRQRMSAACDRFRTGVIEGGLTHDGSHTLARHLGNCVPKDTPSGTIVQKEHPDSPRKIDAAIAAIVAYDRAAWHAANSATKEPMFAWV
jgi:phage terminase large subunit-like protein